MAKEKKGTFLKTLLAVIIIAAITFGLFTLMRLLTIKTDEAHEEENNGGSISIIDQDNKNTTSDSYSEDIKEQLDEQTDNSSNTHTSLKTATPVLYPTDIDDSSIVVQGYISNIVNTEGTCTYTLSQGSESITLSSGVLPNSNNTICEAVTFDRDDILEGEWKLTLYYKSAYAEGSSSDAIVIE